MGKERTSIRHKAASLTATLALLATLFAAVISSVASAPPASAAGGVDQGYLDREGVNFGYQTLNTTSAAQTVNIYNNGDDPYVPIFTLTQPASGNVFSYTTTCSGNLNPGSSCSMSLKFKPTSGGLFLGAISVYTGGTSEQTGLRGLGVPASPFPVSVTPTSYQFGPRAVGSTSPAETTTITNTSNSTVTYSFTGAAPKTSSFKVTALCPASGTLAAHASCQLSYQFKPTKVGALTDTAPLAVTVTGIGTQQFPVDLAGWGTAPAHLLWTALNFGDVVTGTTSSPVSLPIVNDSDASITITVTPGAPANAKFKVGPNQCTSAPVVIPAHSGCLISYEFAPTATGALSTTATVKLSIPASGWSSNVTVPLSGKGVANAASVYPLLMTRGTLNWGDAAIGNNTNGAVTFTNISNNPVTATFAGGTFADGKGFAPDTHGLSSCTTTIALPAGGTCTWYFDFLPNVTGPVSVSTSFGVDISGQPYTQMPVKFTGNAVIPFLYQTHNRLDFGLTAVGTLSQYQSVIIRNAGPNPATFGVAGGGFNFPAGFGSGAGTCPSAPITLQPGTECTFDYRFVPLSQGPATGTTSFGLGMSTGAPNGYFGVGQGMQMTGYGTGTGPQAWLDTTAVQFGDVNVGKTSAHRTVILHNSGTAPLTNIVATPPADVHFKVSGGCTTLAPGAQCSFAYTYTPSAATGSYTTFYMNSDGGYFSIVAHGRGRDNPVAVNDAYNATVNQALLIGLPADTLLANDNGVGLHVTSHGNPSHGTVTINPDGTFTYTPAHNYTGTDAFAYNELDSAGGSDTGTATITVKPRTISDNQAFVKAAYQDFINRQPTSNELSTTVGALDGATKTRANVVSDLSNSTEWVSALVNQLYLNTLGRNGEPGGVAYWSNQLITKAKTVAQVSAGFYASQEYFNGYGGGTNAGWLSNLYQILLQRYIDSAGLSYWTGQVASFGRTAVAFRLFQSVESCDRRVTNLYQKLLGRNPDTAGRDYWAGQVAANGDIALAANLAASAEYFGRAQTRFP